MGKKNMRIAIIALGTRGDVQPAVALGKGLRAAGHTARVIASQSFQDWIEREGLEFGCVRTDIQAMMSSEGGKDWVESGQDPRKVMQTMSRLVEAHDFEMARDTWTACQGADAIISSFTSDSFAPSIAEKLDVPQLCGMLQPNRPSRSPYTPSSILTSRDSIANRWMGYFVMRLLWNVFRKAVNQLRTETLGLPPMTFNAYVRRARNLPVLNGFSPHVIPPHPDWGEHTHTTGYWFEDDTDWKPPAPLSDFLASGPAPVYIGFGSMSNRNPAKSAEIALEALRRSGQRGIIAAGWGGLNVADLPVDVLAIESAPHGWLFPHCAAVVHHGGAGTTAAGLRAGVPSVIIPHFADQPFWGRRVYQLGAGPKPIPRAKLNADHLTAAIQEAVSSTAMRERAAELGAAIRAEHGVANAVRAIECYLN
jgi:sterol 3beta-glucosyltransferase